MPRVHIIGAGLAGLSCAVELVRAGNGLEAVLYDSAPRAGGRCRSFFDESLGCWIDNGNHLLLSGNRAALRYLDVIGARDTLTAPVEAAFPFIDLQSDERWVFRPNRGPLPWWLLRADRRIPGTRARDYGALMGLLRAGPAASVAACVRLSPNDPLYRRFLDPFVLAVMNTDVATAAAAPLRRVLLETLGKGAAAMRPLVARTGLAHSLVQPAVAWLERRGGRIGFGARVRELSCAAGGVTGLRIGSESVPVAPEDAVVLAVPPGAARALLPELTVPEDGRPIVNAHFRLPAPVTSLPADLPFMGLIGGVGHWVFVRGNVASVTISGATDLVEAPAEPLLATLWSEVARALALPSTPVPPARLIREKRATFVQSPANLIKRPGPVTRYRNLWLAGDWTDTGLPATIEGAIRSGVAAAGAVLSAGGRPALIGAAARHGH